MHHYEHFWLDPKFWVGVAFVIFMLIFGRMAWQRLSVMLDARAQRIRAELDEAQQRDTSARRRIDLADRTLEIARRQLDAEEARFRTGSATALQVREAEDQVRTAELRTARARVDLAVAHLAIAHLTGDLLRETASAR